MGRVPRVDVGNTVYHVLNRANFRSQIFSKDEEYREFLYILKEASELAPMRILAYCLMPNHWHLVLYPQNDGELCQPLKKLNRFLSSDKESFLIKSLVNFSGLWQLRLV